MIIIEVSFIVFVSVIFMLGLYPLLVKLISLISKNKVKKSSIFVQPISIIIACYNEEKYIKQKLDSLLHPEEWIPGSELILYSCGSTDNTNKILKEYESDERIKIFIQEDHLSKICIVNKAVKNTKNELLVFSDVRQRMKKGSIKNMVNNFNDPDVGTVTCLLKDIENPKRFSFRTVLNYTSINESRINSCSNVFGALYAQRKSVFREIPPSLLFDDLYVVISTLAQRKRLIMDNDVVLYELPFIKYYTTERIQRLVRGLLLCLLQERKKIAEIPLLMRMRFFIFKYVKLFLPIILVFISIDAIFLFYNFFSFQYLIVFIAIMGIVLSIKNTRLLFLHLIKINFYFLLSTIKFFFLNSRSNKWEKHIRYIRHDIYKDKE